jgi:hypothetical protein
MANTFILLSHERSGSHLAGEFLGSYAHFRMIDEVCNPDAVKPEKFPESFYRYKYDSIVEDPKLLLEPTRDRHVAFVESFFRHLQELKAPNDICIDIKYGHLLNFELWWCPPLERPFLLKFCESNQIGIIHLFRENVVEATVSSMIADRRKVWHSWEDAAVTTVGNAYPLPVHEVVRRAKLLQQQIQLQRQWIQGAPNLELTYERISVEMGQGGALDTKLDEFLGSHPKKVFQPRHKKLTPPMAEAVENFAELKQACETAGLGRFVS